MAFVIHTTASLFHSRINGFMETLRFKVCRAEYGGCKAASNDCSTKRLLIARNLFLYNLLTSMKAELLSSGLDRLRIEMRFPPSHYRSKYHVYGTRQPPQCFNSEHKAVNTHLQRYYYSVSHGNSQLLSWFTSCHRMPHNATSPRMPRIAVNIKMQDSFQENIRFLWLPGYSVQTEESKNCSILR